MAALGRPVVFAVLSSTFFALASSPALGYMFPNPTVETGVVDSIAIGDFNGDARRDAVIVHSGLVNTFPPSRLEILLGQGDGSFGPPQEIPTNQSGALHVVAGDFNRDGRLDMAFVSQPSCCSNWVEILFGLGDGTFPSDEAASFALDTTGYALDLVAADLDGDGALDLAVRTSTGNLCRVLNTPAGLTPPVCQSTVPASALVAADFNEDGRADVVVAGSEGVFLHLSNAGGSLSGPIALVQGVAVPLAASADLDKDGHADLVYTPLPGPGQQATVQVLRGLGQGGFVPGGSYAGSSCCTGLASADLDRDGFADIVATGTPDSAMGGFTVLPGLPGGTFGPPRIFSAGTGINAMALADLDRDGRVDVLAGLGPMPTDKSIAGGMTSFMNTPDGHFGEGGPGDGSSTGIATADLNGDGRPDIVLVEQLHDRISVLLSRGDGTFMDPLRFPCGSQPRGLALADFDADGNLDVATGLAAGLSLLFGHGDGTFGAPVFLAGGEDHTSVVSGDFDGDHLPDLAANNSTAGDVSVFLGMGGGTFGPQTRFPAGLHPFPLVAADVDADGRLDLVDGSDGNPPFVGLPSVAVLYGSGDGTFEPPSFLKTGDTPMHISDVIVADFDGDGLADIVEANDLVPLVQVHMASAPRSYPISTSWGVGKEPVAMGVADLDGDGVPDLSIVTRTSSDLEVRLWRGTCCGMFESPIRFGTTTPADMALADFNGDGAVDVALATPEGLVSVLLHRPAGPPPQHDPVALAGGNRGVECNLAGGTPVLLDGSASTDADSTPGTNDDIVLFSWFENYGQPSQVLLGTGQTLMVRLPLGSHAVTLKVTDGTGRTATDTVQITVSDTQPPVMTVAMLPDTLWPPNHRMVAITAQVAAIDACGGPVTVTLEGVSSSEPDDAPGTADGANPGDITGVDAGTDDTAFSLRAERSSLGPGRTYTAVYLASDQYGHEATVEAQIAVPHDIGGVTDPVDIRVSDTVDGILLDWGPAPGAVSYNIAAGFLLNPIGGLSNPVCITGGLLGGGVEILGVPDLGTGFFYLVEYLDADGRHSGYGSESAPLDLEPIVPSEICP
jgi:hypothetical protein